MEGLDMSLDDIIQKNRILKRKQHFSESSVDGFIRGGGGGGGSGRDFGRSRGRGGYVLGPSRRSFDRRSSSRPMPYSMGFNQLPRLGRSNSMVGDRSCGNADTILHISGLSSRTSHDDIRILFSDVGTLKWYSIHYDEKGVFKGVAEVGYQRHSEAIEAIKRYNNMCLDGKQMTVVLKVPDAISHPNPWAKVCPSPRLETPVGSSVRGDKTRPLAKWNEKNSGKRGEISSSLLSVDKLNAELDKYRERALLHK